MEIRWLGHSAFEIITDENVKILIDPFISNNPACPVPVEELKPDIILVTHGHADHLGSVCPGRLLEFAGAAHLLHSQGLTGQHGFINGGDLMRQRLHVGGMHGHHGIEKIGKADAAGLGGTLEVVGGSVKAPGAAGFSNGNSFFVLAGEQTLAGIGAFSVFVVQGGGAGADRYQGDDFAAFALFNTGQQLPGFNIFKTQHGAPCLRAFSV